MGKRKRDETPRKDGRPKRTLVRWDPDLDIQLLLSIQAACNANQVKIPWDKVASIMGEKFTDGSIIQHLSKMRLRREAEGKPCPPPLRRSNTPAVRRTTKASVKESHGKAVNRRRNLRNKAMNDEDDADLDDGRDDEDEFGEATSPSEESKDPDWYIPENRYQQQDQGARNKHNTSRIFSGTKFENKVVSKGPKVGPITPGFKPTGKTLGTSANDSDSSVSSLSDSEDRLSSKGGDDDSEDRPIAEIRARKIVRFKVPVEALRNLEMTGNVRADPDFRQAANAHEQELRGMNFGRDHNAIVQGQTAIPSDEMILGLDPPLHDLSPYAQAAFQHSQGGFTFPILPRRFTLSPAQISAIAHSEELENASHDGAYRQFLGQQQMIREQIIKDQMIQEQMIQEQMIQAQLIQEPMTQESTAQEPTTQQPTEQPMDEDLMNFIHPSFIKPGYLDHDERTHYPDVPNWTGLNTKMAESPQYSDSPRQESNEPGPGWEGPEEWH